MQQISIFDGRRDTILPLQKNLSHSLQNYYRVSAHQLQSGLEAEHAPIPAVQAVLFLTTHAVKTVIHNVFMISNCFPPSVWLSSLVQAAIIHGEQRNCTATDRFQRKTLMVNPYSSPVLISCSKEGIIPPKQFLASARTLQKLQIPFSDGPNCME